MKINKKWKSRKSIKCEKAWNTVYEKRIKTYICKKQKSTYMKKAEKITCKNT